MKSAKLSRKIIAVFLATCITASGAVTAGAISSSEVKEHTFGVIGNFNECNGWRNDIPMSDDDGDGVYTAEITGQPAGDYEFKVRADSSWDYSWGVYEYDSTNIEIDRTYNSQTNCKVTVESETDVIKVSLDTTRLSPDALAQCDSYANEITADDEDAYMFWPVTYMVYRPQTLADSFGVIGSFVDSGWRNDIPMSDDDGDGIYTAEITGQPAGDYEFKVRADSSWDYSWGEYEDVEGGRTLNSQTNCKVTVESETDVIKVSLDTTYKDEYIWPVYYVVTDGAGSSSDTPVIPEKPVYPQYPDEDIKAFYYSENYDGTITVTGYEGNNTNVVIPSEINGKTVTSIGYYAFYECTGLTSVTIPDSVTSIGDSAFEDCTGLKSITIPDSVTSIGDSAFEDCTGLKSITIPDSVTEIGSSAFWGCTGITNVTIPDSVTSIGSYAFSGCTGITNVTIPDSVTSIGSYAFSGTVWYNNQPEGLVYAGKVAYKYKGKIHVNTKITLKDGTKGIAGEAFLGCTGLKSVTIPDSVTWIGGYAFYGCNNLTIYGTAGSAAETYANENNIKFVEFLVNNSTISKTTIKNGDSVTLNAVATGGAEPYQYAFSVKHSTATAWTTIKSYNTTATKTWKPAYTGTYQICAKVKDAIGTEVDKFFTLTVNEPLVNNSTISKTTINNGNSITLTGKATGGTSQYEYEFTAKHSTETEWTVLKSYNTTSTYTWKPDLTGTYQVCAKVKDAIGTEVDKLFTLTVNEPLVNNSTISKTTINYGDSVTITGVAECGTSPYQYSFTAYNVLLCATTTIQDYSSNSTVVWTPKSSGVYNISLKIKDADETEIIKSVMLVVQLPLDNNSTISSTTINKGDSVTLTGMATGGTAPYTYAYYYKKTSDKSWKIAKDWSDTTSVSIKPAYATTYDVCIKVKDSNGTIAKKYFTLNVET